jgi:phosphate transport system substrate-binding protein
MAAALDYVPMPEKVVKDVEQYWMSEIKDANGKPVYAMTN